MELFLFIVGLPTCTSDFGYIYQKQTSVHSIYLFLQSQAGHSLIFI